MENRAPCVITRQGRSQDKATYRRNNVDVIKANELNPISFQITLKQLYEPAEAISTRLSYNDVMANLFEVMFAENFGTFSIDHSMTSEEIQVRINLTQEKNHKAKKKAQQLAEDTIKQRSI